MLAVWVCWEVYGGTQGYIDAGNRDGFDVLNLMSMDMNAHVRVPVNTSLVHARLVGPSLSVSAQESKRWK